MQYTSVIFPVTTEAVGDMLVAMLSDAGYTGFEEAETGLLAYIAETDFDEAILKDIATALNVGYELKTITPQNWNALWESNFQPVIVDDFCTLRAHFHDIVPTTTYDITITPKMSFGTGHHATTQQMIRMMKDLPFDGANVLDFGTGTGVLAILAEMLGATRILAIDNDEWSVENAIENAARNHCKNIIIEQGSLENVPAEEKDIILANINRHILLQYMDMLYSRLKTGGYLLMSGLLKEDEPIIMSAATAAGFTFNKLSEQANWIAILFNKNVKH